MSFESLQEQNIEKSPESFVELGMQKALEKIRSDFENREDDKENLPFHNTIHTERVIDRVSLILETIGEANPELVSPQTKNLGKIAAAFHDTFQEWEEKEVPNGQFSKTIRKRFSGENEKKSGNQAVKFMEKSNAENDSEVFSEEDKNIVREAIETTIPGYSPEKATVIQPNLSERSSVVARALALADIGAAGLEDPKVFMEEGDAIFKEENLDIFKMSKNGNGIPENIREYYRQRMVNWSNSQPKFAEGRKALLGQELKGLPEQSQGKLKTLFNKFDASIEAAKQRAAAREQMPFGKLLVDMKFK